MALSPPNVTGFQGHRTDGDLFNGRGGAFGAAHDVNVSRCNPLALESYQQRRASARGREEALISPEGSSHPRRKRGNLTLQQKTITIKNGRQSVCFGGKRRA